MEKGQEDHFSCVEAMDEGCPICSGLTGNYSSVVNVSPPGSSWGASRREEDILASPLAQSAKISNKFDYSRLPLSFPTKYLHSETEKVQLVSLRHLSTFFRHKAKSNH